MFLLNLPKDVHGEIFLRLPGKSISLSRCVCKTFYNLLSEPSFIRNLLNRTKNKNPKLLFKRGSLIYSKGINLLPSPLPSSLTHSYEFERAVLLNYPFEPKKSYESKKSYSLDFLGSCNGLICLQINNCSLSKIEGRKVIHTDYYYSILNPFTREYKEFKRPAEKSYGDTDAYGFGYDSKIEDYKLVIVSGFGCIKVYIYTLGSDSWSSIQGAVTHLFPQGTRGVFFDRSVEGSRGVFFNDCLHWWGTIVTQETSFQVIFCFDIRDETMITMPLPENDMPSKNYDRELYANVGVWGNNICVAFICGLDRIDVWVMQQYGVRESWIKKYTTTAIQLTSTFKYNICWKPLWCFDNGEILVNYFCKELHFYDPAIKRVRLVVVCDIAMDHNRESYFESIVSES